MGFVVGLCAAVAGNVVIGAGQCLQKHALNRLQREHDAQRELALEGGGGGNSTLGARSEAVAYSSALDVRPRSGSVASARGGGGGGGTPAARQGGPRARYTSKAWVAGLAMNYAGEVFGNSVALSYLSAAVVAPLGIIAVIVNLVLAERFLGERITSNQRFGFAVITAGVGCILLVAPRRAAADDPAQFVQAVVGSGIVGVFGVVCAVQLALVALIRRGHQTLFLYVLVASLFGSMNVMASKLLTTYARLRMTFAAVPNPADVAFYGAAGALQARPVLLFLTAPQAAAAAAMAASIVGQESFRQQALGRYPVMRFQPVFFATFNVVATLSGLLLFRELDGWAHALEFFAAFAAGIALILYGSRFLQRARAVELPSHIRLHKENLGFKVQ
ncbi:hypothetical protein H4R21_003402 [Coemansia helicoidea]|uniref:Uncharacterized protein n=1 Tax=Coemansia helicoidea TaxID=1286919 RepID=A0ACC1L2V5_9FUNG|nr:hypothetical protein H4R21_003402 [Coemansia helicoidea]